MNNKDGKKGFLGSVGDALSGVARGLDLIEDGADASAETAVSEAANTVPRSVSIVTIGNSDYVSFREAFCKAIKAKGADYFDVAKMIQDLSTAIPDEGARVAAALIACKVPKAKILQTIGELKTALDAEKDLATKDLNAEGSSSIAGLESRMNELSGTIAELEKQLASARDEQGKIGSDMATARKTLAEVISNATKAHVDVKSELDAAERKITQYAK